MDGLPYQAHSATSKAAAENFQPKAAGARRQVYDFIAAHPGSSDDQIQIGLKMKGNTQRPRRVELEAAGLIRQVGTATTATGNEAVTYVVTDKPYPLKWPSSTKKPVVERPTAAEIQITIETMRKAFHALETFPTEAVKVLKWLGTLD